MIANRICHAGASARTLLLAVCLSAAFAHSAAANLVINLNISPDGGANPASTFGAAAATPGVWNHFDFAAADLLDTAGQSTGVSFSATNFFKSYSDPGISTDLQALLLSLDWTGGGRQWNVTLDHVPNATYDVYAYAPAVPGTFTSTGDFDINGGPVQRLTTGGNSSSLIEGINYSKTRLTVTNGQIVLQSEEVGSQIGLAGLQIVGVPEPASLLTMLLGGALALVFFRRRRSH